MTGVSQLNTSVLHMCMCVHTCTHTHTHAGNTDSKPRQIKIQWKPGVHSGYPQHLLLGWGWGNPEDSECDKSPKGESPQLPFSQRSASTALRPLWSLLIALKGAFWEGFFFPPILKKPAGPGCFLPWHFKETGSVWFQSTCKCQLSFGIGGYPLAHRKGVSGWGLMHKGSPEVLGLGKYCLQRCQLLQN